MRHLFASSVLALAAWSAAPAQQAPAQPLAGANRPNLKVLQQLPESQLFILMNLVGDALGVRCDYCHVQATPDLAKTPANVGGWVWASDDKPQKRKAREMMQMVVDLNKARFGGEHKVTCFTCHRGSTHPERTPPLPPPPYAATRTPPPVKLPSADKVWANYMEGVGQGGWTPGAGTIYSGWDDRPEGRYGKFELVVTADRYRATLTAADGTTQSQGIDAEGAWIATNGTVRRLTAPADVERIQRNAMRYRPVKERPANLRVIGLDRVGNRDVYVATARLDSVTTLAMYFDVVTGLLRREMFTAETLLLPLQEQADYDEYLVVNGAQLPFHVQTTDGAPYDLITKTYLQIRHNVPVDESQWRAPRSP